MSRYVFDNSADQAQGRFFALESCYDPFSRRQVELTGLTRGWRCLEVGGGGGSLGDWLGEQVGPDGEVTITDLDLRWAESRPGRRTYASCGTTSSRTRCPPTATTWCTPGWCCSICRSGWTSWRGSPGR
ncbi:hypothetical protein ACIBCS_05425 [Streptomyces phaeochromogenes]|uniref:hypothetical protein n=1 Tax=Streptomyces phaeochromogenes TaxID=1923 RepID=UPI0033FC4BE4